MLWRSTNPLAPTAGRAVWSSASPEALSQFKWGFKCLFPGQVLAAQAPPCYTVSLFCRMSKGLTVLFSGSERLDKVCISKVQPLGTQP